MGGGISIPASEEDAIEQGYSRSQIDEYLRQHPNALRSSTEARNAKHNLSTKTSMQNDVFLFEEKNDYGNQNKAKADPLKAYCLIYDECDGDLKVSKRKLRRIEVYYPRCFLKVVDFVYSLCFVL